MIKKRKNLFLFFLIVIVFIASCFLYWDTRYEGSEKLNNIANETKELAKLSFENRKQFKATLEISNFLKEDDKTILFLLQNNMELRPGGGYIGSFGIMKIKNGKVSEFNIHDTSNFDIRIPNTVQPPYPMGKILGINSWKLRDSNFSPDFKENALKAKEFYYMGEGREKFDAIIGMTTNVLTSLLKVTGPVELEGYGIFDDENAVLDLEYQVEKAYAKQGIEIEKRKSIMNDLAKKIIGKIHNFSNVEKLKLAKIILKDLNQKDIQIYFSNTEMQKIVTDAGWAGTMDNDWDKDYLMMVDANLGSFKSDYFMERSIDYNLDLSGEFPKANVKITYNHTAEEPNWLTKDYVTYLRIYIPEDAWIKEGEISKNIHFGKKFNKKYIGMLLHIPLGSKKVIEFEYGLPKKMKNDYKLKIEKQAGVNNVPINIEISKDKKLSKELNLVNKEFILNEF